MKERYRYWLSVLGMIFLGMIFLVAGVGKLLAGSKGFEPFVLPSFLPQALAEGVYTGLPYIEIIIGGLLILGIAIKFAVSMSALLILGFIISNTLMVYVGHGAEPCVGCFGAAGGLTAVSALIVDGIMAVMVVVIAICYRGSFFNISPLVLRKGRT